MNIDHSKSTAFEKLSEAVGEVEKMERLIMVYADSAGIVRFKGNCTIEQGIYLLEAGKIAIFEAMKS